MDYKKKLLHLFIKYMIIDVILAIDEPFDQINVHIIAIILNNKNKKKLITVVPLLILMPFTMSILIVL